MEKKSFVLRHRKLIILFTLILAAAAIIPLFSLRINPDLESYLPDNIESRINNNKIGELFGTKEPIVVILSTDDVLAPETLERVDNLTNGFLDLGNLSPIQSLSTAKNIRGEDGMMMVNPVIEYYPQTAEEREILRESIKDNDLAFKLLVSEDFKNTMILLNSDLTVKDAELMNQIDSIINLYPGKEEVLINGQPFLRDEANEKISKDIMILLPLGLLIMLIFFWFSFREFKGMILPFGVVLISIAISMSLIPILGWELSIIGVLIPIMMIAIANNYGVHFVARYQEINSTDPNTTMAEIVEESLSYLKRPVVICGLTTIVGILGLTVHILLPASQMGVVSAIGIGVALILSLTFIPAVLSFLKKGKMHFHPNGESKSLISKMLNSLGNLLSRHPKRILVAFSLFFVAIASGVIIMSVASDFNNILPAKHPFNKSIEIANREFGGSKLMTALFEGDIKDPLLLKRMEQYEMELASVEGIGSATSIAKIIKKMSTALNDPDEPGYNRIPDERDAIAQYIELYSMNGDPADFEQFVDFDYTRAAMTIQFNANGMKDLERIIASVDDIIGNDPAITLIGGYSLVEKEMSESIVRGQYNSLIFAFIAIFLLLAIIFKSIPAGLLGSLPLLFAVVSTFGFMGWTGIKLDIVTALLSSVSIGLGVDFTIHMFWRMKSEIATGRDYKEAAVKALKTAGRGITINAFSVMLGFSILFFSSFPIIKSFALLIILSLLFCLVSSLLLVPAICVIFKPSFLKNGKRYEINKINS
ncbi:MAG: MMPL family transporter [Bacteroidales bacterium]|jgi:hypothetical protein|nr:MMPL family transporter [Bacteroidales bacterium]